MSRECAQNFFLRVAAMRQAQKKYYENKDYRSLTIAKKLEREIDGYIERGMNYLDMQHQLQNQQQVLQFTE